jgi:hypothetical protein
MTDNIIKFPNNIIKFPNLSEEDEKSLETLFEEFENEIMKNAKTDADDSAEFIWTCVLMDMSSEGFKLERTSDEIKATSILVLESIRALHYLTKGIEHPLQEVAKDLFTIEKTE